MGQRGSVTAWHVLASGTIDEGVHGLVERKRDVVRAATDGDDPSSRDSGPIVAELLLGMLGTNP
jgi:hypothetical protein